MVADNTRENDFLETLLTIPAIYNYKISPNSRYIAYTWKNVHPNLDIFLVPTDGSRRPIALTKTPEATFIVDFAPDSKSVIVGEDKSRNERVQLFEVAIDKPEEMIHLTEENPPFFFWGVYGVWWTYTNYLDVIRLLDAYGPAEIADLILKVCLAVGIGDILWMFAGFLFVLSPVFKIMLHNKQNVLKIEKSSL